MFGVVGNGLAPRILRSSYSQEGFTMKKLLAGVLVGFVLGLAFLGSVLYVSAVSPPTATKNGDTNGDGNIDISDAVHLLSFLFTGGAAIAEIQCPAPVAPSFFVATGQNKCLGDAGIVDCSIPKARGQDGSYQRGCPFQDRFTDNGDGTITDNCTALMWTKTYVDVDGDGEIISGFGDARDDLTWADACRFAEDMTYLGHSDWRIPNIHELMSIMDFGNNVGPTLFRPYMSVFDFAGSWSSTHEGTFGLTAGVNEIGGPGAVVARYNGRMIFAAVRGP